MWKLGYNPTFSNAGGLDGRSRTAIRDGNFDYVTNQVHWDRPEQPLPDSLYLTGKPAFFGVTPGPGSTRWAQPRPTPFRRGRFDALHP